MLPGSPKKYMVRSEWICWGSRAHTCPPRHLWRGLFLPESHNFWTLRRAPCYHWCKIYSVFIVLLIPSWTQTERLTEGERYPGGPNKKHLRSKLLLPGLRSRDLPLTSMTFFFYKVLSILVKEPPMHLILPLRSWYQIANRPKDINCLWITLTLPRVQKPEITV